MPAALASQNENGTITGANAYGSVEGFRSYWDARGVVFPTHSDDDIAIALIKATDYIDTRFQYIGWQLYRVQGTQWPRGGLNSTFHRGLPEALIRATYLTAQRVLTGVKLMPDPSYQASGLKVTAKTVKAGPVETSYSYAEPVSSRPEATLPSFPDIQLMLNSAGLLASSNGGRILRG